MRKNKKEYERLLAKKAKQRLSDEEFAIFKELQAKFGNDNHSGSDSKKETGFGPGNDFPWWNKVPELLNDAVNLKSNYIPGYPIDPVTINFNLASVLKIDYVPVYGRSRNATDPLNVWARDLYLKMFQKWRGISAYSASDLGIVLLAGVEVVRMIAKLERIYGVVNRYSKTNINMPFTEVEALGLTQAEATYIRDHLSDYRYDLNVLLRKAQRLCIPKDMSILADQISLLNYEYLDHDNSKAQIIIFDSLYFGVFHDVALTTGSSLFIQKFSTTGASLPVLDLSGSGTTMFPGLDLMINALVGSDGVQRIYGDLITWFGESQMLQFVSLPEEYIIVPVKSESILHKIHNIDPCDGGSYLHSFIRSALPAADIASIKAASDVATHEYVIYQVNDSICSEVTKANALGALTWHSVSDGEVAMTPSYPNLAVGTTILDTYRVEVSPEVVTEGLLYKYASELVKVTDGTDFYYGKMISYAFEYITGFTLYTLSSNGGVVFGQSIVSRTTSATSAAQMAGYLALIDWAPVTYYMNQADDQIHSVYGDLDTIIPVYPNVKQKAHIAIVYSGVKTDIRVIDSVHN